ncbi:DEAD-box ATP-dependent RNA helicase 25 [Phytophthora fragariae]|uniref:ATP-dependent RNA helicase n=2 Tax=Phytophthora TaxID=4783 RepID=A0A6A3LI69_9STRA|nr:DEAD-box ATP-dependent RNA helicase 25 [Phytophthora fragariae]KAE9045994.1 DEAD-box ATP-dependent RNA helicase 25 [Phytophthora rubi]KAE8944668.1 DEAD-box ATP-dependent RNA helicase 25 [Phytophthora fragariae]KAE9018260.1 DEAD-box ATP-dependent RNA helicase 25 [Phytophthora fragariae]KAE9122866.1 DEAD-box ATP-dependent RNA helicase 25 [Phytophthora fragariae]
MPGQESNNSNNANWRRKSPATGRKDSDAEHAKKKPRRGGRRNNKNANANANGQANDQAAAPPAPVAASPVKQEAAPVPASNPTNLDYLSDVLFASLDISAKTKRAIVEDLKYERLTNVQNETFPLILEGKDVLAKAKTGNGKTIAFLLPVIENMVKQGRRSGAIPALAISPTRELALQIATEAKRLTKFHDLKVACFVGGANIKKDERALTGSDPIDILVATPGRLVDHLKQNTGKIADRLGKSSVLILDEADRLLDMGFRPDVMRIIGYLPRERQTLLFSATLPASTTELKQVALRKDYSFVDTIDENEADTNVQTEQEYVVCKLEEVIPMVERILTAHMKLPAYKVMLFFPTARSAQFMAQLFQAAGFPGVLEIHSRKSQAVRTKTAEAFRKGHKVMMFSSDVSARGVDYPDVSLVLQVGLTDRDQYIHRLGRTARAGMKGKGVLVLAEFEAPLLDKLTDLPLGPSKNHTPKMLEPSQSRALKVVKNLKSYSEVEKSAQQSYQAWLGFYNSNAKRLKLKPEELVRLAADYSSMVGLDEVPKLEKKTLRKMNLLGVPGIEPSPYTRDNGGNFTGGRGGGRGGGNRGGYGRR